jgi:hypothetical protein
VVKQKTEGTEAQSTAVSVTIKVVILFCHWHKKEAEELMKTNLM